LHPGEMGWDGMGGPPVYKGHYKALMAIIDKAPPLIQQVPSILSFFPLMQD